MTTEQRPIGFVKPDTETHVFFYEQDFYVLSNFSAFQIEWPVDGPAGYPSRAMFDTSEQLYHWLKFCDTSPTIANAIFRSRSAHDAFKLAEQHKADRRPDWDVVKVPTMKRILRAKADQHEYVRRKLLATGDRELIEDSWRDDFWGWGPNCDGENMLGRLWMEVRNELRPAAESGPEGGVLEGWNRTTSG
ncbi:MAG TPA: NADAR family protein, partial [Ramlibacter sp.]|nr:NADAR family protein [Ramlibacter sp.]